MSTLDDVTELTEAVVLAAEDAAWIERTVATLDTAALQYRHGRVEADRTAWPNSPIVRAWLDYEQQTIEAELTRRGATIPATLNKARSASHVARKVSEVISTPIEASEALKMRQRGIV